jgi:thiamine transporter ThiT
MNKYKRFFLCSLLISIGWFFTLNHFFKDVINEEEIVFDPELNASLFILSTTLFTYTFTRISEGLSHFFAKLLISIPFPVAASILYITLKAILVKYLFHNFSDLDFLSDILPRYLIAAVLFNIVAITISIPLIVISIIIIHFFAHKNICRFPD